jgi:uroporphyrinogen-III synthase|tara:strand:- start:1 stop:723 length:723 start_codon:yes stop_codon:yes gene_type:complete
LRRAIESGGAKVLSLPLIEIRALNDAQAIQDLKDKVLQLDCYQSLIFVSNNAVSFGGEVINNYWPQFPLKVDVIAVGPTTAEAASERFACEVIQPTSGMTSEDILRLPQLQDVSEKKIGIVRGQGGRELLADTLRERGAIVDYLEAYSRTPIDYTSADFCNRLLEAGVNVLTVSSGESLDRLTHLLVDNRKKLQQLNLLVPSQRVGRQAENAGYQQVHSASGADPLSFVSALGELGTNQE